MKRLQWILVRIAALAIVLPLGATLPVPSVHAAGPAVSTFYPSTKPDYDAWPSRKYAPPPNTPSFPSRTAIVAFYFAYSSVPNQTVYVGVVENSKGAILITGAGSLSASGTAQMFWVQRPKLTFPDGTYKVTLTLGALPVATTTFTVGGTASSSGGGGSGPNPGGGSGPAPGGNTVKISPFYTVSQTDFNDWAKLNYPTPSHSTTYASGKTWWIPVYFGYSGAVAKTTQYSADLRDSTGKVVATTGPYVLSYAKGRQELYIPTPNKADLVDGSYTAEVLIGGQVAATTTLTVGGTSPAAGVVISPFYPVSQTDFNAWAKLNYPTPAQATTYASGKTWWIPVYFGYSGAVAKTTQYSADLRDSTGKVVATTGPFTFSYAKGRQELYIPTPNKVDLADGSYTAEVLIGSQVAATTTLTIGGAGAAGIGGANG